MSIQEVLFYFVPSVQLDTESYVNCLDMAEIGLLARFTPILMGRFLQNVHDAGAELKRSAGGLRLGYGAIQP